MNQNNLKKRPTILVFYNFVLLAIILAPAMFNLNTAYADYKDDVKFKQLEEELTVLPDGNGIKVTQIEAGVDAWMPDPSSIQFIGKEIIDKSGITPGQYSGHATSVGGIFYGNTSSMTPGINSIDSFSAIKWLQSGFLNTSNSTEKPFNTSARVANHSWIGSFSGETYNSDALRRLDWLIDQDEYIQVAALSNGSENQPLLSSAFNAIVVGRTDNGHGHGLPYVDAIYTDSRVSPDIVAPMSTTSSATPVVASGAALLVHLGHNNPALSNDPELSFSINRNEKTIYNAERSEVIKAALMAGAVRCTSNSGDTNIIDYRSDEVNIAPNGLDSRYGAGQINIYQGYHIIAAGEQNSYEDDPENNQGEINIYGFDYDPCFGGEADCNNTGSYYFSTDSEHIRLVVNLSWNLMINGGETGSFDGTATLYDLDLILYDITDPDNPVIITSSESRTENSENIWILLEKNRSYLLEVVPGEEEGLFRWDYALAWRLASSLGGDFKADEDVDGVDLANYINSDSNITLKQFASDFGKVAF